MHRPHPNGAATRVGPVTIQHINPLKICFLQQRPSAVQELEQDLLAYHAEFRMIPEENKVMADFKLAIGTPNANRIAGTWFSDVKGIITRHLGRINFHRLNVNEQNWQEMEERVKAADLDTADVVLQNLQGDRAFVVVGRAPAVDEAYENLKYLERSISSYSRTGARSKPPGSTSRDSLRLESYQLFLLTLMSFKEDMEQQYQGLTVLMNNKTKQITFAGNPADVEDAQSEMHKRLKTVTSHSVRLSEGQIKLLGEQETRSFVVKRFRADSIIAVWQESNQNGQHFLQVYAPSVRELQKATEILKELVVERECQVPMGKNDFMQPDSDFQKLVNDLKDKDRGKLLITTADGGRRIVITGTKDVIETASVQVKIFVQERSRQTKRFPLSSSKARFVKGYLIDEIRTIENRHDVSICPSPRDFTITGTQEAIQAARKEMNTLVSSIVYHEQTMTDDLHIQFLNTEKCKTELESLEKSKRCVLSLDPDSSHPQEGLQASARHDDCARTQACAGASLTALSSNYEGSVAIGGAPPPVTASCAANQPERLPAVKIVRGEIAEQRVDMLVNSAPASLNLNTGAISKSIFKAAGEGIQDEIRKKYPSGVHTGTVVYTRGHNLHCQMVCHMALKKWCTGAEAEESMSEMVLGCLMRADKMRFTSVAFPTLGTGTLEYPPEKVAKTILNAISFFYQSVPTTTIRDIRIVVYSMDDKMFQVFYDAKRQLEVCDASVDHQRSQQEGMSPSHKEEPMRAQKTALYIYAKSTTDVTDVRNAFDSVLQQNIKVQWVKEKQVSLMTEEEIKYIEKICQENRVNPCRSDGYMYLRGLSDGVLKAAQKITTMFHSSVRERSEHTLAQVVQWCYVKDHGGKKEVTEYSLSQNYSIEEAYKASKPFFEIVIGTNKGPEAVVIDFGSWTQYPKNNPSDKAVVERKDKMKETEQLRLPDHWTGRYNGNSYQRIALHAGEEYRKVQKNFQSTLRGRQLTIKTIERLENATLWQQYQSQKYKMDQQNVNCKNEKTLWHGTHADAVDRIAQNGFNRSYCGKNATRFGQGVYFAKYSWYSTDPTYSQPDPATGNRYIFQCKVLVGVSVRGDRSMRTLPDRPGTGRPGLPYDSATDNPDKRRMFVIFSDTQAYPEYLITFTDTQTAR